MEEAAAAAEISSASVQSHHDHRPSVYDLLPGFMSEDDELGNVMVNGWNAHLEKLLLEIQNDANVYFAMLTETAQRITFWKWVFIITYALVAMAGIITTGVALASGITDIWLPILNACISGVGALYFTMFEALAMNEWAHECKVFAGDFIMLGRRIESQKRIPRAKRYESGIKFSNAASMRFEELRKDTPNIPCLIARKYRLRQLQPGSMPELNIPLQLLDYHAGESPTHVNDAMAEGMMDLASGGAEFNTVDSRVQASAAAAAAMSSLPSAAAAAAVAVEDLMEMGGQLPLSLETADDSTTPTRGSTEDSTPPSVIRAQGVQRGKTFQEIFEERLRLTRSRREQQDDLERYEDYVRRQFSGLGARLTTSPRQHHYSNYRHHRQNDGAPTKSCKESKQ